MKKFIIALAAMAIALVSCQEKEEFGIAELASTITGFDFESAEEGYVAFDIVSTRDWTATVEPATESVTVEPMSGSASNDPVKVTVRVNENTGKTRNFKVIFKNGESKDVAVKFTQPGKGGISISDIAEMELNAPVSVEGLVIAMHDKGCIIEDASGRAFVYDAKASAFATVGKTAKIEGQIGEYNGMKQIVPAEGKTLYTETDAAPQEVTFPADATVITKDNHGSIDWKALEPISLEGVLSQSEDSKNPGKYFYNISFESPDVTASIAYPTESLGLKALNGHKIVVKGYTVGTSGQQSQFLNILAVSVEDKGKPEVSTSTIDKVIAAEKGASVGTEGTVMAVCDAGYIISDATGSLFIYTGGKPEGVEVGNKVEVSGTKSIYNEGHQIEKPTTNVKDASTATPEYGEPLDLTNTDNFDAYTFPKTELVKFKGILTAGKYIDIQAGKSKKASLYKVNAADYTGMDGAEVTVIGYGVQMYSGNTLNAVVVSVEAGPFAKPAETMYTLNPTDVKLDIPVKSNTKWTVACNGDWIKDYTKSGEKDGTISLTFDANTGAERTATLTLTAEGANPTEITVTQKAEGQTVIEYIVDFGGTDCTYSKYTNNYSETFTATTKDMVYDLAYWNNGQASNEWTHVRAGNKSKDYISTISTHTAFKDAIKTVTVTIEQVNVAKIRSHKLEVATDASFSNIVETVQPENSVLKAGDVVYTIKTPQANCFYRLSYDQPATGENGTLRVGKVTFSN